MNLQQIKIAGVQAVQQNGATVSACRWGWKDGDKPTIRLVCLCVCLFDCLIVLLFVIFQDG